MFTGLYPRHHGLTRNGVALDPSHEHLTHVMMDNGVRTYGVGKFHFQPILPVLPMACRSQMLLVIAGKRKLAWPVSHGFKCRLRYW